MPNSEESVICSAHIVNKFKGRKPLSQNVSKTLLVSDGETIAEIYLIFAFKAFSLRRELLPTQLVELW